MIEHEEWRPVEGYEDRYEVSSLGRVRSLNYRHTGKCVILKAGIASTGYPTVDLSIDGKKITFCVHRLVAKAFLIPVVGKDCVDHINGQKDDCRVENLRFCSPKENSNFELARKHNSEAKKEAMNRPEVKAKISGKNNYKARAVLQLSLSGEFIRRWDCIKDAERETGCYQSAIIKCCRGKYKTCGGYRWEYEKTRE